MAALSRTAGIVLPYSIELTPDSSPFHVPFVKETWEVHCDQLPGFLPIASGLSGAVAAQCGD